MAKKRAVLIIDDEENMRHVLKNILEKEDYITASAADGHEALQYLEKKYFDIILCDLRMPRMGGMEFLKEITERKITSTIITMSAYGSIELAIETMKLGAYDYISKPFKPAEILLTLKKAEERQQLKQENILLRREVERKYSFKNFIGKSPGILGVIDIIKKIAGVKSSVLITGESGTGKELVARAIHYNSQRRDKTFLAINCAAIPEALLESELFGHKKGAFTGAVQDRAGFFEEADKGTLFLDEIGDLSLNLQVKLLRALQEGEIRRVGDDHPAVVDVRLVAATAKDLMREVGKGCFREDLYYRLNVLPIHIPPLRERRQDIPLLIKHFIAKYNKLHDRSIKGITPATLKVLVRYDWPGNIRELENIIERSMIMSSEYVIGMDDMPEEIIKPEGRENWYTEEDFFSIKKMSRMMEEKLIRKALNKAHGNKTRASKLLEISYPALLSKISEYGIVFGD